MDLDAALADIARFLEHERISFALVGALAVHAYGHSRATNDLDLLVVRDAQDRLVPFLESEGFETLHRSEGYSNHLHPDPSRGRVDVVYVDRETWDKIGSASRQVRLATRELRVPKPEHLVAMKVHAMRNDPTRTFRDMADIQYLMTLPGVDREEIRGYFADAELLERFRELERSI
ncbi:MAG TPA: nucleotidyl transferase AbiEii/AbiGii toxin family protein [Candidatus Polarisedimenticolaceae bacterium]|nr:nucleotidyl transferase AbiEii/AbiGii toxin family protein [Candidatus Polarisedimenticolaceae bacterium]